MPIVRHATLDEVPTILQMCNHSRNIMRKNGNTAQWVDGYPSVTTIMDDIQQGVSYVIEQDHQLIGAFAFIIGTDPTYTVIHQGEWIDNTTPYGTLHRLASAPGAHGIARTAIQWALQQIPHIRIDTHSQNHIMQHIATTHGFHYCGIIYVADGTPRLAYEKIL